MYILLQHIGKVSPHSHFRAKEAGEGEEEEEEEEGEEVGEGAQRMYKAIVTV